MSWSVTFTKDRRTNEFFHRNSNTTLRPFPILALPHRHRGHLGRLQNLDRYLHDLPGNEGRYPDSPLGNWAEHLFEINLHGIAFVESMSVDGTLKQPGLPDELYEWGLGYDTPYEMKCSKGEMEVTELPPTPSVPPRNLTVKFTFSEDNVANVLAENGVFYVVHYDVWSKQFYYYQIPLSIYSKIKKMDEPPPRKRQRQGFLPHGPYTMSDPGPKKRSKTMSRHDLPRHRLVPS